MNILQVTHRYPPNRGGVETHVHELAIGLTDRGHDVTVFSADKGSHLPSCSTTEGVEVRRFRSLSISDSFYFAPQIAKAVRGTNADVIHAHNYHAFPLLFAALGVTDERFVLTAHYHGGSANAGRDALLSLYQPVVRWALRRADDVIAVSEWERERLRNHIGVEATVIPNGIDIERFHETSPEARERPYLLSVGRLEEYKGIQHVIRALPEISGYDLVVAGEGEYRSSLERIAVETGVEDRVEFLGYVPDDRLPGLYAGASVYVALSSFEAYGMTVAEALAAGTPCVILEEAALSDWTEVSGVVGTDEVSQDTIARVIAQARDAEVAAELLTWDEVVEKLLSVYRN